MSDEIRKRALHRILSISSKPRPNIDFDQNPEQVLEHLLEEIELIASKAILKTTVGK